MTPANEIEPKDAQEILIQKAATFIDVRDPASYQEAHIENSLHITDQNIEDFVTNSNKEFPIIVYCYHGNSSLGAAEYLQEKGFKDVKSMAGGFEAWRTEYSIISD